MNNKLVAIIRREFTTRVMTKAFIITTVLLPVVMLVAAVAPALLMQLAPQHTTRLAVVDTTADHVGERIQQILSAETIGDGEDASPRYDIDMVPAGSSVADTRKRLVGETGFSGDSDKGQYDGVLVVPDDVLEDGSLAYYGANASSPKTMAKLESSLSDAVTGMRLAKVGVDQATVNDALRGIDLNGHKVSNGEQTGGSGLAAYLLALGMCFILYMAILMFGQQTMTSVIEEKSSRVVELLVSSVTPFRLLLGKVLGVGSAGLLQMAIWGGTAWLITSQGMRAFGGSDQAGAMANFSLPHIGPGLIVIFLAYFVLGYLLYGALYAAIGSMCSNIQDSQQYVSVLTAAIVIGFFCAFAVASDPDGTLGRVLCLIPFFAPFVMPVRWALTSVSGLELFGSLALMVVGMLVCVWIAARIYHTGLLMFGKKPGWRQLWQWLRTG